jgi:hypothetical protein
MVFKWAMDCVGPNTTQLDLVEDVKATQKS